MVRLNRWEEEDFAKLAFILILSVYRWEEENFAKLALILILSVYRKRNNFKETLLRPLV